MMECEAVVLAAGHGTRMNSSTPKVLHDLLGRPMLRWTVEACAQATGRSVIVVVGPEADQVRAALPGNHRFAVQEERLGTAHAAQQAEPLVSDGAELVLVVSADMPLLRPETLARLIETQIGNQGPFTALTAHADTPRGFGRVVRDDQGRPTQVVEAAHASPEQLAIRELNVGAYCFRADWLWSRLPELDLSPKGEYYITDLVEAAAREGEVVETMSVESLDETIGINTRLHLAEAERALQRRINRAWMRAGVTMQNPDAIYVGPDVQLAPDVVLLANTHLQGGTTVKKGTTIGPNSVVRDARIGEDCQVRASVVEEAVLEDQVEIGPFAHLRPGAYLEQGVHMGNFGEVKNSRLGQGVRMGHFSYVGDATVGSKVNIGAGTITCNYDGERKHATEIEEGAFIGSDTMLVAPVTIGRAARTGAGAVVTKDVPDGTIAVGVPARVIRKLKGGDE